MLSAKINRKQFSADSSDKTHTNDYVDIKRCKVRKQKLDESKENVFEVLKRDFKILTNFKLPKQLK